MNDGFELEVRVTLLNLLSELDPAGIVHEWGETLEQGTEPPTAAHCSRCVCTWMG